MCMFLRNSRETGDYSQMSELCETSESLLELLLGIVIHILFRMNQVKLSSHVYFENAFGAIRSKVK